jgi:hypothetical protein
MEAGSNMKTSPRARVALTSVVAALAVMLVGATSSQAAVVKVTGSTTVTPSTAATQFLTANGVTVAPTGKATTSNGSWTFPVAAGFGVLPSYNGVLAHAGGLKFTKGDSSLTLRRFVAVRSGRRAVVLAQLPGRRGSCGALNGRLGKFKAATKRAGKKAAKRWPKATRDVRRSVRDYCRGGRVIVLANVTNMSQSLNGSTATLTGDLVLSRQAAKLVNRLIGTKNAVPAGAPLGSAVSTVTPK